MRTSGKQLLLVAGAAILTAALYFAPQKVKETEHHEHIAGFSFEELNKEAKGQLKRQEVDKINELEAALQKDPSSVQVADSIGKVWEKLNMPQISSHYFELVAVANPAEKSWINTAYRYYDASRMTSDSTLKKHFVEKAISSYQNVLKINPDNLDAKTDLGLCYADGPAPMQGILLLREVVEKNPQHEMAQYNLGILSVKSGQYDKAVDRFEKVLQINPANVEARFLLGRTYVMMGKKDLALKNLELIKDSKDSRLNEEVNVLINQINNN
jgi:cytochrome c-type biogenesis protein CcmH/NrfG